MKNIVKRTVFFFLISFVIDSTSLFGQDIDFNNYTPLLSQGKLPEYFLESKEFEFSETENGKFETKKAQLKEALLKSGKIIIGDTISNYLNQIFKLLYSGHGKYEDIHVHALKSSSINAMSAPDGNIYINLGLIARLNNEAELAFIIAHEAAHYFENHSLKSFNELPSNNSSVFKKISIDSQIDNFYKHSQKFEFEADSIAFNSTVAVDYSISSIFSLLKKLHYDFLPFDEFDFPKNFFNDDFFNIPNCFFLSEVDSLGLIEDYYDRNYTHPNIRRRLDRIEQFAHNAHQKSVTSEYLLSEEKFKYIREVARFETIRLDIHRRNYVNAIYNSAYLLKKYPDNSYLKLAIGEALYGLAKYKVDDKLSNISRGYIHTAGQVQQLYYLVKQLTKSQLTTLALKYNYKLSKEYTDNQLLDQRVTSLMRSLHSQGLGPDKFEKDTGNPVLYSCANDVFNSMDSIRHYQYKYKDFHKLAFVNEFKDRQFSMQYDSISKYPVASKLYGIPLQKYLEKMKVEVEKGGIGIHPKSVTLIQSFGFEYSEKSLSKLQQFRGEENDFHSFLTAALRDHKLKAEFVSHRIDKSGMMAEYNRYCAIVEWLNEFVLLSDVNSTTKPIGTVKGPFNPDLLCFINVNKTNNGYSYFVMFNSIETGKLEYVNRLSDSSLGKIKKQFLSDLNIITN